MQLELLEGACKGRPIPAESVEDARHPPVPVPGQLEQEHPPVGLGAAPLEEAGFLRPLHELRDGGLSQVQSPAQLGDRRVALRRGLQLQQQVVALRCQAQLGGDRLAAAEEASELAAKLGCANDLTRCRRQSRRHHRSRDCGHNAPVTTAERAAARATSSASTPSASHAPRPYVETERHIRERRARGLFGRHALHDGPARGLVPSGEAARGRAQRRLGRALLLRAGAGAGRGPRAAAAVHLARRLRRAAREARRARARARRRRTACSSTRTSTSTARRPRARASASTARTRC